MGQQFLKLHQEEYEPNNQCPHYLQPDTFTTSLFRHFEECPAVTSSVDVLFGDELTAKLQKLDIQPPSEGKFAELWKVLSRCIHNSEWFKDSHGAVIVPNNLEDAEKRFLIRFLLASGHSVVVAEADGTVRDPLPKEIETPEKLKREINKI